MPVAAFRPNRSQQRAWKANQGEVSLEIGQPTASDAHRSLYDRFHRHQSREKGWRDPEDDGAETFLDNPFETEEWRYTLGDRLIGVGYVDRLPQALSAIYFYWDPGTPRSLGTYNVLSIIERARTLGVPNVYLGYYVEGCRSLAYKAAFRRTKCLARTARGSRSSNVTRSGREEFREICRRDRQSWGRTSSPRDGPSIPVGDTGRPGRCRVLERHPGSRAGPRGLAAQPGTVGTGDPVAR